MIGEISGKIEPSIFWSTTTTTSQKFDFLPSPLSHFPPPPFKEECHTRCIRGGLPPTSVSYINSPLLRTQPNAERKLMMPELSKFFLPLLSFSSSRERKGTNFLGGGRNMWHLCFRTKKGGNIFLVRLFVSPVKKMLADRNSSAFSGIINWNPSRA